MKQHSLPLAAVLGGACHCLESRDGFIACDRETMVKAVALVREFRQHLGHGYRRTTSWPPSWEIWCAKWGI